jgi:hypothetical protein
VGAFKCAEAVGSAIASKVNSEKTDYNVEFAVDWAFVVLALVCAIPFVLSIQDATPHAGQETVYVQADKGETVESRGDVNARSA